MRYPDLSSLADRRVLITGAASGIGRATALRPARQGAVLVLTDRDADGLEAVAAEIRSAGGTVALAQPADITDLERCRRWPPPPGDPMDVVMNIAGISAWGTVENLDPPALARDGRGQLMGPIHVIETFVPPMIAAGRGGWLVNVSSAAGLIGLPWHAAYSATKFGLRGVSEVLRFDLRQHGIGVSLVCPGGVATPLTDTVEVAGIDKTTRPSSGCTSASSIARSRPSTWPTPILRGLRRHRYLVYTSPDIRALHSCSATLPPRVRRSPCAAFNTAMTRAAPPGAGRDVTPRIAPGTRRDVGLFAWLFAQVAGRVTGHQPAQPVPHHGAAGRPVPRLAALRGPADAARAAAAPRHRADHPAGGPPARLRLRVPAPRPPEPRPA